VPRAFRFFGASTTAVDGSVAAGAAAAAFFRAAAGARSAAGAGLRSAAVRGAAGDCLAGAAVVRRAFAGVRAAGFRAGCFCAAALRGAGLAAVLAAAFFGAARVVFFAAVFRAAVRLRSGVFFAAAFAAGFFPAVFLAALAGALRAAFFGAALRAEAVRGVRDAPALPREVFAAAFVLVAFLLPDADLDVFAVFAAVRCDLVTDLDCLRGSAFPPFELLAFFAFGLAFPAIGHLLGVIGKRGIDRLRAAPARARAWAREVGRLRSTARQDSGGHDRAPQPAAVRSAASLADSAWPRCADVEVKSRAVGRRAAMRQSQAAFAPSPLSAVCSLPCGITGWQNRMPVSLSWARSCGVSSGWRVAMNSSVSSIHAS
jgi:hypothetical protein